MEALMDEHADCFKWPPEAVHAFETKVYQFLALATALAGHFHARGVHLNPRLAWNYAGEDFMQQIEKLCQSCHSGTHPSQ
eukprot:8764784-Alexandrium_andersonii.AAC.1